VIYMPMVLEAVYAMLACARIGAVHSVVFGGFSAEALRGRVQDCDATVVITADEGKRGGKAIPLKDKTDEALKDLDVDHVIVLEHTDGEISWTEGRDFYWHDLVDRQDDECPCEPMRAEDPLFILYTSGSTGKPKGVLHTTGGYMVYVSLTHEIVFDYHPGDVYWCTADVGWVTGHSYIVYGPLANGATNVIFEGTPAYPDYSRLWQIVDKYKVNIFYTAPTAIRALLRAGDAPVKCTSRKSLRVLGSVGEPINHEAWLWYYNSVGEGRCPILDTWWQTETGGIMLTPLVCDTLKPGATSKPFLGIKAEITDKDGKVLEGEAEGYLCIADSWPGQMRTVYGDHERFIKTYFSQVPGKFFTDDGARRDEGGDYWITGRIDDVINVSGHRLSTAEIENAINEHKDVSESAVVGYPHDIKGQGIYAYVTLLEGKQADMVLKQGIIETVRTIIGPIATPDTIRFTNDLPKTRSGKIMRRILRKIAANDLDALGDISTLANPEIVDKLIGKN
jgi:acetyl-CoA synthetase